MTSSAKASSKVVTVSEAGTVQFPMVEHAHDIGWDKLTPAEALEQRRSLTGQFLYDDLEAALIRLNPGLVTTENVSAVIAELEAVPPTMEGNRQMLQWLRGERTIFDPVEGRQRYIKLIDFDDLKNDRFAVTWEWSIRPDDGRKGNRADVMFAVNGIPLALVEHKNPKLADAIQRGVKQVRRYEIETPELLVSPQVFNVTHLVDYWYGVTWNATAKDCVRWKERSEESYRFAVQSFFERTDFLRMLQQWILFYTQDDELKKAVLRQHQVRAIYKVLERCADPSRHRGLIWHTQGSGKTFTLLTAARLMLENDMTFKACTVILVVDRIELEGQLKGWVERLLGELQGRGIAIRRAESKQDLQEILESDFRGLVLSMIHKFDDIKKDCCLRDNVFVLVDEAHRSVGRDLGIYLMAAVPNATIIGFTGTPVARTANGDSTFQTFGADDPNGYLDRYRIIESIEDRTTLPLKHTFAPSDLSLPAEDLEAEFFKMTEADGVTDIDDLNRILDKAVNTRTFLKADDRVDNVAKFIAKHFQESVDPLGLKAFLVAVDREACAKYKTALDRYLPSEWTEAVYSPGANDVVDRPEVAKLQISTEREKDVRALFRTAGANPKILIVTDKLLTGYDAPILYCMYLDKPMRDHILLQAISRVNRPYIDSEGVAKKVGLVLDFVSVLKNLKKALRFDSEDIEGVFEDLDALLVRFKDLIAAAESVLYAEGRTSDERLERIIYGKFADEAARESYYTTFREIEDLWEVLSPSPELRDYIETYNRLADLYAILRNAYATSSNLLGDLDRKTRKLVEENAQSHNLGAFTKTVTFDAETLASLQAHIEDEPGRMSNLVRGLHREAEERSEEAPFLITLSERADRVVKDFAARNISGVAALQQLEKIANAKSEAERTKTETGLTPMAFAAYWVLRDDERLTSSGIDTLALAREIEKRLEQYNNYRSNPEDLRRLRAAMYVPLLSLAPEERSSIVDAIITVMVATPEDQ